MSVDPADRAPERKARLTHNIRVAGATFLASSLVHELSQPLSAINAWSSTCLNLVKQDGPRERLVDRLELLVQEAQRASEIIREFRNVVPRGSRQLSEIDLGAFLFQLRELLSEEAERSGVTVSLDPDPGQWLVTADPALLEMAVYLLFRNSLEALEDRRRQSGEIIIKWRKGESGSVTVTVEDTGPGLDQAMVSCLFDPFVSTRPHGVGLGLPLCRTAIESLGGRVWLVSSSSSGTAFAFELPAVPGEKRTEG